MSVKQLCLMSTVLFECYFLAHITPLATSLTYTDHSCISTVVTGMHSKTTMGTLSESGFTTTAAHTVIPNWTTSPSVSSIPKCSHSSAIAQLTTDDCGILQVPAETTHSPPGSIVQHFHTPLMWTRPSHQSHFFSWAVEQEERPSIYTYIYMHTPLQTD